MAEERTVEKRADKVAIVGFTDHRSQALELDPEEWELWGLNELHQYMPVERFDRWFEIHPRSDFDDEAGAAHLEALKEFDLPVYMRQRWDDIPPSVTFPKARIEETLGSKYFTSCPAWMLGLALADGYEEIAVYGIDMANETEYAEQRPCCEHWLGYARGRGVEVYLPPTSDLLKCFGQYAFEDEGPAVTQKFRERVQFLHGRHNNALAQYRALEAEYRKRLSEAESQVAAREAQLVMLRDLAGQGALPEKGAKELMQHVEADRTDALEQRETLEREFRQKRDQARAECHRYEGAINDCEFWISRWGVPAAKSSTSAVPDRSKDPRTGIRENASDEKKAGNRMSADEVQNRLVKNQTPARARQGA